MEMKKLVKGLIVAGAMVAGGSAIAATQGTLGLTSTGTIDISVGVGDQIQITALADITGPYVPGTDFNGSSPACVYSNGGTGAFDVTMTSANGSGTNFQLNDSRNESIGHLTFVFNPIFSVFFVTQIIISHGSMHQQNSKVDGIIIGYQGIKATHQTISQSHQIVACIIDFACHTPPSTR